MGSPGMGGGGGPIPVIAQTITPRTFVDQFTALGTAEANESIDIRSRTNSVVTRINFREGQTVKAGQVLVELDARQDSASLSLAEAQLAQAESQFRRSQTLASTQAVSAADLDQLEANLRVAKAQVRGAEARLDTLYIKAPFPGVVGLRQVSLGDFVSPETIMTTLDDTGRIRLKFAVPETFLADLSPGMQVNAESPVYPGRTFKGQISSIDSRVDPVSRSVAVIANIPNGDQALKPGMFLTVALRKQRDDVLLVPEEALVPRQGRQYVFLIEDGKAVEREVTLGGRAPGLAEVRGGLGAGARVITEGTQRVRDGVPVQVAPTG
jgi:membrane fusion protein, multidrug efflux system